MPVRGVVLVPPALSPSPAAPGTELVANRPIICHALGALADAGIGEVAVVGPTAATAEVATCIDRDPALHVDVTYLVHDEPIDLLGALRAAAPFVGGDACVVHFADGLLGQALDPLLHELAQATPDVLVLLHRSVDGRDSLGAAAQRMLGITQLVGARNPLALAGVCLFGPGAFARVSEIASAGDPVDDLVAVAERLAHRGQTVDAAFVRSWRRYTGDPLDLLELNRVVLDQQAPDAGPASHGDNRIEGRVIIHPTAEVTSSVILGPSIVGAGARISNSYIGPYTSIGADAEIEGAEIVGSIVAEGARILHVGGRIEASTIGRGASIFRDFKLPRAMRLHVGQGDEVALT